MQQALLNYLLTFYVREVGTLPYVSYNATLCLTYGKECVVQNHFNT